MRPEMKKPRRGESRQGFDNAITFQGISVMTSQETSHMSKNITPSAHVIPFRKAELLLIEHNDQPFVPMKPVVVGMGLDWKSQHVKLSSGRFAATMVEITTTGADGKRYEMSCLPLRKLTGWLMSISPNKVKPELRDGIIAYQNECDDALWAYWSEGRAVRSDSRTVETVLSTTIGADGFRCLATVVDGKVSFLPAPIRRKARDKLWSQLRAAFGVRRSEDIPATQLDAARNFVAAYAVEGEWLPQQKEGEFTLGYYEAQDVNHLVHHVLWCAHRWSNGISAGVQAMNRPLWLSTFEHFQEMERTARRIERTQPALIGYFRERLSALRPDDCAAQGVLA